MPQLTFLTRPDELAVEVLIGLDGQELATLHSAGQPLPAPISARGLLDTGTNVTCISPAVLQQLGLMPKRHATTTTASGVRRARLFSVSLSIANHAIPGGPILVEPNLLAMELPAALPNVDALIGLDILLKCRLLLDGPGGVFTLDF